MLPLNHVLLNIFHINAGRVGGDITGEKVLKYELNMCVLCKFNIFSKKNYILFKFHVNICL